jgi:hypothetical protein
MSPISIGELSSTVEVAPGPPGAGANAAGASGAALAPSWSELERHRALAARAAEARWRTSGGGFDD